MKKKVMLTEKNFNYKGLISRAN